MHEEMFDLEHNAKWRLGFLRAQGHDDAIMTERFVSMAFGTKKEYVVRYADVVTPTLIEEDADDAETSHETGGEA